MSSLENTKSLILTDLTSVPTTTYSGWVKMSKKTRSLPKQSLRNWEKSDKCLRSPYTTGSSEEGEPLLRCEATGHLGGKQGEKLVPDRPFSTWEKNQERPVVT
jgi:hypothetical protein